MATRKDEKRLTAHLAGSCRNLTVSKDGKQAVYEFESELFGLDVSTGAYAPIKVEVPSDDRLNPVTEITVNAGANQFAVSPDGKRMVIAARGDLFLLPERGGTTRRLTSNLGRDYAPAWLDAKRFSTPQWRAESEG